MSKYYYRFNNPTKPFLSALSLLLIVPTFLIGFLLYWAIKPLIILSHLLMMNFNTAKSEAKQTKILVDLKDMF